MAEAVNPAEVDPTPVVNTDRGITENRAITYVGKLEDFLTFFLFNPKAVRRSIYHVPI